MLQATLQLMDLKDQHQLLNKEIVFYGNRTVFYFLYSPATPGDHCPDVPVVKLWEN